MDEEQKGRLETGAGQRNTWDAQIDIKRNIFLMAERKSRTGTLKHYLVIGYSSVQLSRSVVSDSL